jgi:hypothetical protein
VVRGGLVVVRVWLGSGSRWLDSGLGWLDGGSG